MTITIDKHLTTIAALPLVKDAVRTFRASYDEETVSRAITDAAVIPGVLVRLDLEAFPADFNGDDIRFFATAYYYGYSEMSKVTTIINSRLDVTADIDVVTFGQRTERTEKPA